jgi:hypothetical protein
MNIPLVAMPLLTKTTTPPPPPPTPLLILYLSKHEV